MQSVADTAAALGQAGEALDRAVRAARNAGASWADIARAAGMSRQAAQQRWDDDTPTCSRRRSRLAVADVLAPERARREHPLPLPHEAKEWPDDSRGRGHGPHQPATWPAPAPSAPACGCDRRPDDSYVTGDPGDDGIVEYLAEGWLRLADYYDADDTTTRTTLELIRSLRLLSTAAARRPTT